MMEDQVIGAFLLGAAVMLIFNLTASPFGLSNFLTAPASAPAEFCAKASFQLIAMTASVLAAAYQLDDGAVGRTMAWLLIVTLAFPSGMHLNPSVSVAFWTAGKLPFSSMLAKLAAQAAAGVASAALVSLAPPDLHAAIGAVSPVTTDLILAFLIEAGATALMVLMVLICAEIFAGPHPQSMVVATLAIAIGLCTGGCTDPAGALAFAVFSSTYTHFVEIFVCGTLLGAAIGGLTFAYIVSPFLPKPQPLRSAHSKGAAADGASLNRISSPAPTKAAPATSSSAAKARAAKSPARTPTAKSPSTKSPKLTVVRKRGSKK